MLDEFYVAQKRRSTDFAALEFKNIRSGGGGCNAFLIALVTVAAAATSHQSRKEIPRIKKKEKEKEVEGWKVVYGFEAESKERVKRVKRMPVAGLTTLEGIKYLHV